MLRGWKNTTWKMTKSFRLWLLKRVFVSTNETDFFRMKFGERGLWNEWKLTVFKSFSDCPLVNRNTETCYFSFFSGIPKLVHGGCHMLDMAMKRKRDIWLVFGSDLSMDTLLQSSPPSRSMSLLNFLLVSLPLNGKRVISVYIKI